MRNIYQQDSEGCWIACVAMITSQPYEEIRSRFSFRRGVTGRSAGPIRELLSELGFDCEEKSTKISAIGSLCNLQEDALVYTKNVDQDGDEIGGHWMVWDAQSQVLRDPEGWAAARTRTIKNFRRVKAK